MSVKCILTGQTPSVLDGVERNVQVQLNEKQNKITANGLLKGDGNGNITAATEIALNVNINLSSLSSSFLPTQVTCNYTQAQILSAYEAGTLINCNIHVNSNDYPAIFCLQNGSPAFVFQQLDIEATGDMPALIHTAYVLVMTPDSWILTDIKPNILKVQSVSSQNILEHTFKQLLAHITSTRDIIAVEYANNIYFLSYYGTDAIKFNYIAAGDFLDQQQIIFTPSNVTSDNSYVIADVRNYTSIPDTAYFTYTQSQDNTNSYVLSLSDNVKNTLNGTVNPNLLDNWYFGNPVNQRGQTSYTGIGYGIDRWKATNANTKVTLTSLLGLTLQSISTTAQPFLAQTIENIEQLLGKTVTLSALTREGTLFQSTGTFPATWPTTGTFSFYCNITNVADIAYNVSAKTLSVRLKADINNTEGIAFKAVKLELGSVQTLAHKEGTTWVVNEIPDHSMELLKCQRYFQIINSPSSYDIQNGQGVAVGWANSTTSLWVNFPLSVPMRISPTPSIPDITLFKLGKTTTDQKDITKAIGGWATKTDDSCNMRSIIFTSSGLTAGDNYILFMKQNAKIALSADL